MPLTAAQICSTAQSIARCPGYTTQAGNLLNSILSDLCQQYDFDVARQSYAFTFNTSQINYQGQAYQNLPSNYLRGIKNGSYYIISGVPYPMIPCDFVEEYNMLVEQSGLSNFPVFYATDMSLTGVSNSATGSGGSAVPVALRTASRSPRLISTVRNTGLLFPFASISRMPPATIDSPATANSIITIFRSTLSL